jgi:hexulose-6-phosphate isomerase
MENPPWVAGKSFVRDALVKLIHAMSQIGAELLVIPLVDNSSIKGDKAKEDLIIEIFLDLSYELKKKRVKICFEVDLPPQSTSNFIELFPSELFGINYDIGNSASLGYDPVTELTLYGHRVMNVHVKDRVLGGSTIKLGEGCADFLTIFELLEKLSYSYNYILQTARAIDDDHESTLVYSKLFVEKFLGRSK